MPLYLQLLFQGLATGALYGVAGVGMQLILGSTGKAHLAAGQVAVIAALFSADLALREGFLLLPAMLGVSLCVVLLSYLTHPPGLWRLVGQDQGERAFLLITLGGAMSLEGLAQWFWPLPLTSSQGPGGVFYLAGIPFTWVKAFAVLTSITVPTALWGLLNWSKRGMALRAWDMGLEELRLVGVDPFGLGRWVTSIGLGIVSLGGVLVGATQVVSAQDGLGLTIRALCLAVLGLGLNPFRTMGLGWALGLGEALVSQWCGPQWHQVLAFALLPMVLCFRKKGLG